MEGEAISCQQRPGVAGQVLVCAVGQRRVRCRWRFARRAGEGGLGVLAGGPPRAYRCDVPGAAAISAGWGEVETFTFLFTDIEGSTALLGRVGQGVYAQVLAGDHWIIRSELAAHGGREVDTQGDAFFAVFLAGGVRGSGGETQRALQACAWPAGEPVRVRMGVHTGQASVTATGLVGLDVHRAARVAAAGHGGQVRRRRRRPRWWLTRCRRGWRWGTWVCTG